MNIQETTPESCAEKGLLKHVLNVVQHSATREELDDKFTRLEAKLDRMASRENLVAIDNKLTETINRLETKLDKITADKIASKEELIASTNQSNDTINQLEVKLDQTASEEDLITVDSKVNDAVKEFKTKFNLSIIIMLGGFLALIVLSIIDPILLIL